MTITYAAQTGAAVNSPAMDETLANQSQQSGNNQVIVSDTLVNAGNGNIGDGTTGIGDSYVGRLLYIDRGLSTEQVRRCTAETAGTGTTRILTVGEDWDTNPVATTDTIAVPYELADWLDDIGSAIGLNTKTGFWELGNLLSIKSTGLMQMMDAIGIELDDQGSSPNLIIESGGTLRCGFLLNGAAAAGVQITSYNPTLGEPGPQVQSGGKFEAYDTLFWGLRVGMQFENANGSDSTYNRCKWVSFSDELHAYDTDLEDSSVVGRGATTDIMRVDAGSSSFGAVLAEIEKLDSAADTTTETIELEGLQFINVAGYVDVRQNKTWNLIDPVWDVTVYTDLTWTGTSTGNELNDRRSIKVTAQEADGTKLQDTLVNVYENTQLADLVLELVTAATTGYIEGSFIYRKHATNSVTTTYGGHALQVGKWLYKPLVFTQPSDEKFNGTIVLAPDNDIVQTTQATAITAGSGITWNEDTNPSELFDFTLGSGTVAVGMILTFSPSGAVGTVTELLDGDSTAGTIHLEARNATAIANGDTFSRTGGTAGTFSGTYTNNSKQAFSIWIDGNSTSAQTIYDYLAARQNETTLSTDGELIWEWCRDQQTQPFYAKGSSFCTERAYGKGIIVVNVSAGTIDYYTDDAGVQWVPPVSLTITFTNLINGSEVRIFLTGTTTEVAGVESVTGNQFQFSADIGQGYDVQIFGPIPTPPSPPAVAYLEIREENVIYTASVSLAKNQQINRNYFDEV